jgi:biopolymer transport protein ExbB
MKKFLSKTIMGIFALGTSIAAFAQEAAVEESFHQAIKIKFIEGSAGFMGMLCFVFIIGLAFALERIVYLNLADTNASKLLKGIEDA